MTSDEIPRDAKRDPACSREIFRRWIWQSGKQARTTVVAPTRDRARQLSAHYLLPMIHVLAFP